MSVRQLTNDDFEQIIADETKTAIVDFYADWCGPCKMIAPVLEEIAAENEGVSVYKVNIDENHQLAARFDIRSIPCIISFKGGQVHKRTLGAQPKEKLLELVD